MNSDRPRHMPIDCQPELPARFWSKVRKTSGCWEWTGGLSDGYGLFWWQGSTVAAHRLAYQALVGPIAKGTEIDHVCRNRKCVNPKHLRSVRHRTNVLAGGNFTAFNAKKVRCPKGHEYKLVPRYDGTSRKQRKCRECERVAAESKRRAARLKKWSALWAAVPTIDAE